MALETRANFEWSNRSLPRVRRLHLPETQKHEATVLYALPKTIYQKIAIRCSTLINWARVYVHDRLSMLYPMVQVLKTNFSSIEKP